MTKTLSPESVQNISSEYLRTGRKQDSWEITAIEIDDKFIHAKIRMNSYYQSPTDENRFHLTIYSTLEFLSQLWIIYIHDWAGLEEKNREVWMVDCQIFCKRALRDPDNIQVSMEFVQIKNVGQKIYAKTKSRVYDKADGLFKVDMKGFLS